MKYEGWANYHTWNVALWISNEEPIYRAARYYSQSQGSEATYDGFLDYIGPEYGDITGDGVSWTDPTLDHTELDTFIQEIGA
jgi:hypothetical protein